ncbi:MAG: hypothetical protein GY869_19900, partial [Planctomycetes bacterium]|nr:hypothetical protein [Planctomycetota bacterium]
GGFNQNNAGLSYYNPDLDTLYNAIFLAVNDEEELGDIANSMAIHGSQGYISVTISDKVSVINLNDCEQVAVITHSGLSPRCLAVLNDDKAYISSQNMAAVWTVDLAAMEVGTKIDGGGRPEGIVIANGKAYGAVSGWGSGNIVSVIDTNTDQVIGEITVGDNPVNIRLDEHGQVVVMCWGSYNDFNNPDDDTPGKMMIIDPASDT